MNKQNIKPDQNSNNENGKVPESKSEKTGLDKWNSRLDHNLEPEEGGDAEADERAEDYSAEKGSGDQSDDQ